LPTSPCGPTSANTLAGLGGALYATDFNNNLYAVDPVTGKATKIGATGIPAILKPPFTTNSDGSTNLFDESLFASGGKLYATFDAYALGADGFTVNSEVAPNLYQIDPSSGAAALLSPTALQILSSVDVNGTVYAIQGGFDSTHPFPGFDQAVTLDLTNGATTFVSTLDPAAGPIFGVSPVPEPASVALAGIGIAALGLWKRRRRSQK
jgi:hypothetical protein